MIDPYERRHPSTAPEVRDRREPEHTRRNALQHEMLLRVLRRQQHQAHIERALQRVRQEEMGQS